MPLTIQEIDNLACYYLTEYYIEGVYDNLVDTLTKYGNDRKYCLFRTICRNAGFVILSMESFKLHINQTRHYKFLGELHKHFYTKILK